jgi:cytochrome c-type biogenesis protein
MRRIALAAAALMVACGEPTPDSDAAFEPGTVAVGAPAPLYATQTLAGDSISLADLRGKVVLLNVWATWCHPCRDEIPELEALHAKHRDAGLEVVGVSVDGGGSEDAIKSFIRDFEMTYPVWLDPEERVSNQFLTIGVPETFLIDREGVIRWRKIGPIGLNDPSLAEALGRALGD